MYGFFGIVLGIFGVVFVRALIVFDMHLIKA